MHILFDLDNTLIDSNRAERMALKELFSLYKNIIRREEHDFIYNWEIALNKYYYNS